MRKISESNRVGCLVGNGTPAKGALWDNANALSFVSQDGHNASVWNTFSMVLETCCCQPRWTHGSSTSVAWTWSGVAPATRASHVGNSTPRAT